MPSIAARGVRRRAAATHESPTGTDAQSCGQSYPAHPAARDSACLRMVVTAVSALSGG